MAHHKIYSECPLGPDDIRLVTVLPGSGRAEIVCQLETVYFPPLSEIATPSRDIQRREYKALSYTWGTDRDTRSIHFIHFEGLPFGVTRNLFEALIHLRDEKTPLVLWVDAICIDQRSEDEKNRQLPRMRQIYAQATETILWLGSATFFSSRAFRTAESLLAVIEHRGRPSLRPTWVPIWIWESFSLPSKSMDYVSLILILRSQYFARTWIVQEIVLSPNPIFVAGYDRVHFRDLAKVAELVKLTGIATSSAWRLAKILSLRHPASQQQTRPGRDLVAVAALLRNSHAADARDKLYGFLGLCEHIGDVDTYGLEPDYGLTATEVYTQFAASVLGCQKSLDLFGFVQTREESRPLDLPSWVPDWSDTNAVAQPIRGRDKDSFAAAGNTMYLPSHTEDGQIPFAGKLRVFGHRVDEIEELGCECNTEKTRRRPEYPLLFLFRYPDSHRLRVVCEWQRQFCRQNDASSIAAFAATITMSRNDHPALPEQIVAALDRFRKRKFFDKPVFSQMTCILALYVVLRSLYSLAADFPSGFNVVLVTMVLGFSVLSLLTFSFVLVQPAGGWDDKFLKTCEIVEVRRMAKTKTGRLALVPSTTCIGDLIFICKGGSVPLVLRPYGNGFRLVGESFVYSIMHGDTFDQSQCKAIYIV